MGYNARLIGEGGGGGGGREEEGSGLEEGSGGGEGEEVVSLGLVGRGGGGVDRPDCGESSQSGVGVAVAVGVASTTAFLLPPHLLECSIARIVMIHYNPVSDGGASPQSGFLNCR